VGTIPTVNLDHRVELEQAMTKRTARGPATFVRPFGLGAFGEQLPGGRYPTKTDEELLKGLSLLAYRRTATMQFKADPLPLGITRAATIAPRRFEGAGSLEDAAQAPMLNVDPPKAES
jgi:hypothetical protein